MKKIFLFILVFSFSYSCCDCPTSGENNSPSQDGVTQEESKPKEIYCPKCGGSGLLEVTCSSCNGSKQLTRTHECTYCDAFGRREESCDVCHGNRKVPALE
jgi:hypothetical protein